MKLELYLEKQLEDRNLSSILLALAGQFPIVAERMERRQSDALESQNVYGEKQLPIDLESNEIFLEILKNHPAVSSIASEELENEMRGPATDPFQSYSVAFDPLDGSSLVDVNQAVGSIFGIYKGEGFLGRKGAEQVAALLVVYGPRLTFALTLGNGTVEFLYDEREAQFVFSGELKLAEEKKMFAPGNLRACSSEGWYLELLQHWVLDGYTLRYSGGMVPDINQILRKGGGIFTYPGYSEQPHGKLRLLYECAPMAFLIEQAGGAAVSWSYRDADPKRTLELIVSALDQRTPIFLGSKKEVQKVVERQLAIGN